MTESLIIHELDNRFLDKVCEDDVIDASVTESVTVSHKEERKNEWSGKVDHAEEVKSAKYFHVDDEINQKVSFW